MSINPHETSEALLSITAYSRKWCQQTCWRTYVTTSQRYILHLLYITEFCHVATLSPSNKQYSLPPPKSPDALACGDQIKFLHLPLSFLCECNVSLMMLYGRPRKTCAYGFICSDNVGKVCQFSHAWL